MGNDPKRFASYNPLEDVAVHVGKVGVRAEPSDEPDEHDPEGDDEDGPTPESVKVALGFDPDEE